MKAREGDFVETTENLFFDVKGLIHPPDRIVAYLRYYPDERGTRLRDAVRYKKVYNLSEREQLLRRRWPEYLYYDEMQGRELQGVPAQRVRTLHTPQQHLSSLMRLKKRDALEESAAGLIEILAQKSRASLERFGISGSLLVGLHSAKSDIDIIAYGIDTAKSVQEALFALLEEDERFHRYELDDLKRLRVRRGLQTAMSFRDFVGQEKRKAFQGKFHAHEYFVRCVKDWPEIIEYYGGAQYRSKGLCTIFGRIIDDKESLLTPCTYSVGEVRVTSGVSTPKPIEVVSFRGRFAEQAKLGEQIIARGRLEVVTIEGMEYSRVIVGEGANDVLRVVS